MFRLSSQTFDRHRERTGCLQACSGNMVRVFGGALKIVLARLLREIRASANDAVSLQLPRSHHRLEKFGDSYVLPSEPRSTRSGSAQEVVVWVGHRVQRNR